MKLEPISPHDVAVIVPHLARHGEWEGVRLNCRIRLVRFRSARGECIEFAIQIPRRGWQGGEALTVADALQSCNRLIADSIIRRAAAGAGTGESWLIEEAASAR